MKPKQRKKLYALIEQQTRCEIMARLAPLGWQESGDYAMMAIEKLDEIRKMRFGTSNILELGQRWGIIKEIENEKKQRTKQQLRVPNKSRGQNKNK